MEDSDCNEQTKDHLNYLTTGDEDGEHLGQLDSHGLERIVGVHDGVDGVVHHHEEAAGGGQVDVGEETHPHDSDVMIPVKKDQLLLPQNYERCVKQFHDLKYMKTTFRQVFQH